MKNIKTQQILLIVLIATVLISAGINIPASIQNFQVMMTALDSETAEFPVVAASLASTIGQLLSWFNFGLFIFIIFFYKHKKLNLLWILLPYLGYLIFGFMKLLEKKEANETA